MLEASEIVEGTVLAGRYEVIERLGSGGMATVYLAEDTVLGRRVAVKRLRADGSADPPEGARLRRFRREARLGATLSHPNVVTVFDTVAGPDGVLIVMEYVEGRTLADVLADGPLEPERAIEVLSAVAAALDHAHEHEIVHRDVKPANVLIGDDGSVKLADLGIATAAEATRITTANDIVGTLAYIAPERLDSSSPGGPEADIYGLAVLAYEALTGVQVNRGTTPGEVLNRAAASPPPDLRDDWPEAPAAAAYAVQAGMSRDPASRPRPASELVDRLADSLAGAFDAVPVTDEYDAVSEPHEAGDRLPLPPRPPSATAERPGIGRRIPRAALIVAAGLALAALVVVGINLTQGGDDRAGQSSQASRGEAAADGDADRDQAQESSSGSGEEPSPEPTAAPEPETSDAAADGAALNEEGYALIQQGRFEEAIPVLERAVESFPEGTTDLNYAYALFNLGNALREAGRPEEAIPILEQRLQIPNQTETVQRELDLARDQAR